MLAPCAAAEPITEWLVPWPDTRPRDPYVDSKGNVWFCGQGGGYLGRLDPASGKFDRFDLGEEKGPHNLIIDREDQVWYAGNRSGHIGRLDPRSGAITKFAMPDARAGDPHTLAWDQAGNIWFTVQHGNLIGRLAAGSGEVTLVEVPTSSARPYGIVVAADDRPWIALFGTHKLATVDPQTMQVREIELPRTKARPRRLGITSDGAVWYVDYAGGRLGRYHPGDGRIREWTLPGGERAWPYGMAVDDRDRLWIAETGSSPNRLVGFDPRTEEFFAAEVIPSGGDTVRHMVFHARSREIWFGTDANTVARARVP